MKCGVKAGETQGDKNDRQGHWQPSEKAFAPSSLEITVKDK
jgi:hypothetical protein